MPREITIKTDVVDRKLGEEIVLVDLQSGAIVELNPVGARIWELLRAGKNEPAIGAALQEEFDVDESRARDELGAFIGTLLQHELVVVADPA